MFHKSVLKPKHRAKFINIGVYKFTTQFIDVSGIL